MSAGVAHGRGAPKVLGLLGALAACSPDGLADVPPTGGVEGYLCDPINDVVAVGVNIRGEGASGPVQTQSDGVGHFVLAGLASGPQMLEIEAETFTDALSVNVVAGETLRVPDPPCLGTTPGGLEGKICGLGGGIGAGSGWLENARVFVIDGADLYETTTNDRGEYRLTGVPPGPRTLQVQFGDDSTSLDVTVISGATTELEPVCVGNDVKVALVTGMYDAMDDVLMDLTLKVKDCVPSTSEICPTNMTPNGQLTLFDGSGTAYITQLLLDPVRLAEYDILFFTCGFADIYLTNGTPPEAFDNLYEFVDNGGSIYVSDWAYEIVRLTFPGLIDFHGDDNVRGAAKVGLKDAAVQADVDLAELYGTVGNRVTLLFDKGSWVVPGVDQSPAIDVWMRGQDVSVSGSTTVFDDVPMLMRAPVGSGNVFFTTFHAKPERSTPEDILSILSYLVARL